MQIEKKTLRNAIEISKKTQEMQAIKRITILTGKESVNKSFRTRKIAPPPEDSPLP